MTDLPNLLQVSTLVLGSSVLGGLLTAGINGRRDSAAVRREGFALAMKTLVARSEFPYRIRRRTADDADTLAALTHTGNDIQEQLAACRIWVSTESPRLGKIFEQTLRAIDLTVGPATQDAWTQTPIGRGSEMNLGRWGPGNQDEHITMFARAVRWRFGWRRLVPFTPHVPPNPNAP
jgi:hypothetical protein